MTYGDHISLFSGIGMTDLAVKNFGFRTIATAESDPWNRSVLKVREPDAKHFHDVRDVSARKASLPIPVRPLIVTGGFPCQDVNSSGTGLGLDGERSGLVREQLRIIAEFQPEYALFENSSMLTQRGLSYIVHELVKLGYHVRWECLTAGSVDAPHLRDRCWIMARHGDWTDERTEEYIGHSSDLLEKLPRAGIAGPTGYMFSHTPLDTRRTGRLNATAVHGRMLPTPTKSDGSGGPGTTPKRTGGKNLRTVASEIEGNGRLNPNFVEWMMGLPLGWSDPHVTNDRLVAHPGWRDGAPCAMTVPDRAVPDRGRRIQALGNGLVPQVADLALDLLINGK